MGRIGRDLGKRLLVRLFHFGQRMGVDILPRHFYSEIPDIARLARSDHWREPFSMLEVQGIDLDAQAAFVAGCMLPEARAAIAAGDIHARACAANGTPGFGPIEAEFLHAFVQAKRPARIVQIGCGVSTAVCLRAAAAAGIGMQLTCIEPYPTGYLRDAAARGEIVLVEQPVETMGLGFLRELGDGDLFFVDSTHTLGPGGEVSRIILEMLPRLAPGVYAHFHDITFPYDFQADVLEALFHWHESTLLLGFLTGNRRFGICASLSMLHFARRSWLREQFPGYRPRVEDRGLRVRDGHYPSSLYLRVDPSLSAPDW